MTGLIKLKMQSNLFFVAKWISRVNVSVFFWLLRVASASDQCNQLPVKTRL